MLGPQAILEGCVAKDSTLDKDLATSAAETVGRTLGSILGTVERLRADHPHPVSELQEVVAHGQAQVTQVAADVGERAAAVAKAAKRGVTKIRKAVRTKTKPATGRATKVAKKSVKKTKSVKTKSVKKKTKAVTARTVKRAKKAARTSRRKTRR
jgi:hypothetical protein